MKKTMLWLLPILLIGLLTLGGCDDERETGSDENPLNEREEPLDLDYDTEKVLVKVNGDAITQGEYDTYILQLVTLYQDQHGMDLNDPQHSDVAAELQIRAMDELIEQRALVQRSRELDLSVSSSYVDQQVQGIIQQQGSEEAFESFLESRQLTRQDLEALIEEDYLISAVYEHDLDLDDVNYEEEELEALYDRFVEQRESMGRDPEPFETVEEDLKNSLMQRLQFEKQQAYIEELVDNSDIEFFFN